MVTDQFLHAQSNTNKRKFYLIKSVSFYGWKQEKNFLIFTLYIDRSQFQWVSVPEILQKDIRELCLYLPAKNLEASFIVVSLWCYKSGTTSVVWGQSRIHKHSLQTVYCIMYLESLTTYTMEVNRSSSVPHAPAQNKLRHDFTWQGRWLICGPMVR